MSKIGPSQKPELLQALISGIHGFIGAIVVISLALFGSANFLSARPARTLEGYLTVVWVDPKQDQRAQPDLLFILSMEDGRNLRILPSEEFEDWAAELWRLRFRRVQVDLKSPREDQVPGVVTVVAVRIDPQIVSREVSELPGSDPPIGNRPWISLLCKFPDIADEPETPSYYSAMYDNSPGLLGHYWREVSYDNMDLDGSRVDGWRTLPKPWTYYFPDEGQQKTFELAEDCTAVADPFVDFSNGGNAFQGINMIFNGSLNGPAGLGGPWRRTLDGVTKLWGHTWLANGALVGTVEHEMGHGFGLPHSNNSDRDQSQYDNPWDVMSGGNGVYYPDYGRSGPHTHSEHKDQLGWIAPGEKLEVSNGFVMVDLDPVGAAFTSAYRMIKVLIEGNPGHFYTVEARETVGSYEAGLPGTAVIICEVLESRWDRVWVVDADDPPANVAITEGVMWRVGETFVDEEAGVSIHIKETTQTGFRVTVSVNSVLIFSDGFESGGTTAWSATME